MKQLPCCNTGKLTVEELKSSFLFGIPIEIKDTGEPLSDEYYQLFIDGAYEHITNLYDIQILPEQRTERLDLYLDQAMRSYFMFHTNAYPILWDEQDRERFPIVCKAYFGEGIEPAVFPTEWLRVQKNSGAIHVYPTSATMGSFIHQFTAFTTSLGLYRREFIPQYLDITYWAGFCPIPKFMNILVGKLATINLLNVAGDIMLGAGIASYSVSMDGLSQSISTTQSAENSATSARIKKYEDELKRDLPLLKAKFGSIGLVGV